MNENLTFETGSSAVVNNCQVCNSPNLAPVLFLGYLPPVNQMHNINSTPHEQPSYPAGIYFCKNCTLVQLGLIVDAKILFPSEYPYTSSTTKILRENFAELYQEATKLIDLKQEDLVIDIGSNDGNLLSNFQNNHRVLGVTPEDIGNLAIKKGIPTIIDYFSKKVVDKINSEHGKAKIITATNVFAHIEDINKIVELILETLSDDGVFISESHYLLPLIQTLQYDTIYHEHLRYYSLHSLQFLLKSHGLEIFHVKEIPTHGGSVRVYAAKQGKYKVLDTVSQLLNKEKDITTDLSNLMEFKSKVVASKLELYSLVNKIKKEGHKIYGIGAPSRASTLINYVGLDDGVLDCVLEIKGSYKIGKYMPGTLIPVLDETKLYEDQPEYVMLLSWHIADELIPKIKQKGFKGKFIIPLANPKIIE